MFNVDKSKVPKFTLSTASTLKSDSHHPETRPITRYDDSQGKYTTKSDVWAFAVTLWEILNLGRRVPYEHSSNEEVVQSLRRLHRAADCSDADGENNGCKESADNLFNYLPQPTACSKDIYDLMLDCWRREETERPTFREISMFLQRKNLGYAPTS